MKTYSNKFFSGTIISYRTVLVLIFAISSYCSLYSQPHEIRISKITDEKENDPGATFGIAEDANGFLWFGTVDGLYRYDGYNYKIFRNEKENPNSIAWNTIRALCYTDDNKLWIGTQGAGLDCFDLTTSRFTHYPYSENSDGGISGNDVWALTKDRNGNIWAGIEGKGVDMLNTATGRFTHFDLPMTGTENSNSISVRSVFADSKGIIWAGTISNGLVAINPETNNITNYRNEPGNEHSIGSNDVYHIFETIDGEIAVCAYTSGLNILDTKKGSFRRYNDYVLKSFTPNLVRAGAEKRQNEFWIGTEYGLVVIDTKNGSYTTYQKGSDEMRHLSDDRTRVVFKDSKGIVWVATESGVDKIVEQQNFGLIKNKPGDPNSIPSGIVRCVLEDNEKNLWLGIIDNGLVRLNTGTGRVTRFTHNQADRKSISGYHITSSFQDSEGKMWFGEWDTGLNLWNSSTGEFSLVAGTRGTKARLTDTRIQFIREAKPGVLWIGTESGINRYDTRTQKCSYIVHDYLDANSLSGNSVQSNAFIQDSGGNLWVGTWSNGLNRIVFTDPEQREYRIEHIKYDPESPEKLNNNNVISLFLDGNKLWIGTFGGGLNCMDIVTRKFTHFTTDNGLPNNIIFAIQKDEDNCLWLSTDRGLSRFDIKTESFQNYSKPDGLQDDHFFWGSTFKSKSGEMFFGGIGGVTKFYPENIRKNSVPPVPVLTELKIFENPIESEVPVSSLKSFKVPYDKSYITFEFSAMDFADPRRNNYRIRMDGLDNEWHNIGNRRFTSYSNLRPGDYTFRLMAANSDGSWSEKELTVQVKVTPPWWSTWFARIAFIVLVIGTLTVLYYLRLGMLEKQTHRLEELVAARTGEIEKQKSELIQANTTLTEQKEELSEALNTLQRTQNQLIESEKMASLGVLTAGVAHEINNPLNFIQAGIYSLEEFFGEHPDCKTFCNNHEEVNLIIERMKTGVSRVSGIVTSLNHFSRQKESLSQACDIHRIIDNCLLILNNQIKYKAEVIKIFENKELIVNGNEGKLHQLFLNIIMNAIQAIEEKGIIEITTAASGEFHTISIKDNGCGIHEENINRIFDPFFTTKEVGLGTGLGLSISYGIVREHRGSIEFKSVVNEGTEAVIKLPAIAQNGQ